MQANLDTTHQQQWGEQCTDREWILSDHYISHVPGVRISGLVLLRDHLLCSFGYSNASLKFHSFIHSIQSSILQFHSDHSDQFSQCYVPTTVPTPADTNERITSSWVTTGPASPLLWCGSSAGTICAFDVQSRAFIRNSDIKVNAGAVLAISGCAGWLWCGSATGCLLGWPLDTLLHRHSSPSAKSSPLTATHNSQVHQGAIRALLPVGVLLWSASDDGSVVILLIDRLQRDQDSKLEQVQVRKVLQIDGAVMGMTCVEEGTAVAVGGADGVVYILDAPTGRLIHHFHAHRAWITTLAWHSPTASLFTLIRLTSIRTGLDRVVRVWHRNVLTAEIDVQHGPIWSMALSDNTLFTGHADGYIYHIANKVNSNKQTTFPGSPRRIIQPEKSLNISQLSSYQEQLTELNKSLDILRKEKQEENQNFTQILSELEKEGAANKLKIDSLQSQLREKNTEIMELKRKTEEEFRQTFHSLNKYKELENQRNEEQKKWEIEKKQWEAYFVTKNQEIAMIQEQLHNTKTNEETYKKKIEEQDLGRNAEKEIEKISAEASKVKQLKIAEEANEKQAHQLSEIERLKAMVSSLQHTNQLNAQLANEAEVVEVNAKLQESKQRVQRQERDFSKEKEKIPQTEVEPHRENQRPNLNHHHTERFSNQRLSFIERPIEQFIIANVTDDEINKLHLIRQDLDSRLEDTNRQVNFFKMMK